MKFLDFLKKRKTLIPLIAIFTLSGWFFIRGIDFGLPELFHDDEHFIVDWAVKVASGNLHVTWFDWPGTLLISTNGFAFAFLNLAHNLFTNADLSPLEWFVRDHVDFYLLARLQTVAFAFGVVALTYALGKRWQNANVGIIAALFVGMSYLLVRHAHFATTDVPLTFFFLAATYAGLRIGEAGGRRWYALAGLAVGFGMMTKYTGVAGVVPVFIGHVVYTHRPVSRDLLLFLGVSLLAVTAANPFLWAELPTVFASIVKVAGAEQVGRDAMDVTERLRFYTNALATGMGNLMLIAAVPGALAPLHKRHWKSILLLGTFLLYFIGIMSLGTVWERYMVPLAPFLALFAASGIASLPMIPRKMGSALPLALVAIILLPSFTRSLIVTEIFARTRNDTRFQARAWVEGHLPDGTRIAQEKQTPRLSGARYRITPSQYLSMHSLAEYKTQGVEYVIASGEMFDRFFANDSAEYEDERAFYTTLFETKERVFQVEGNESGFRGVIGRNDFTVMRWLFTDSFSLRSLVTGPDISIYKL